MEAVGKLAGGIAHDFNNVLTAIIGFSDLLLQTHRPTDPPTSDIMNIQSERLSRRRHGAAAACLLAAADAAGRGRWSSSDVAGRHRARMLKTSIGEKIELKIAVIGRDLWHVKADKIAARCSVMVNLAVNARDAMPDGGNAHRRTAQRDRAREPEARPSRHGRSREYVLFEVDDTGVGMAPEVMAQDLRAVLHHQGRRQGHRPRPVDRATASSSRRAATSIPESAVGQGTTFRVYLPRYMPDERGRSWLAPKRGRRRSSTQRSDRQRPRAAGRGRGRRARVRGRAR